MVGEGDARCPQHPEAHAIGTCARCGTFVCATCGSTRADGQLVCPACDERIPQLEHASRAARFWANTIDSVVVMAPLLMGPIVSGIRHEPTGGVGAILSGVGWVMSLCVLGVQVLFARQGQSLGKKLFRIRVVRNDGGPVTLVTIIFLRNIIPLMARAVPLIGNLFGLVDAVWIFGERRQCLHDLIASTIVIQVPREGASVAPEVRVS